MNTSSIILDGCRGLTALGIILSLLHGVSRMSENLKKQEVPRKALSAVSLVGFG
jgi:hypothetical protein